MPDLEKEYRHGVRFWEVLGKYSDIRLYPQEPDEPDFCADTPLGLIGIEHTQLVHQKDQRGVDPKSHAQQAERIVQEARNIFRNKTKVSLYVKIGFRNDYGLNRGTKPVYLSKNDVGQLSTFIADFVFHHIPPPGQCQYFRSFDREQRKRRFPEKIDLIIIVNDTRMKTSIWRPVQTSMIPSIDESPALKKALRDKNKKPIRYQQDYQEIWLLMVEDAAQSTHYFDFEEKEIPTVDSPFNRVFVFRYADAEIIELENSRPAPERWPHRKM